MLLRPPALWTRPGRRAFAHVAIAGHTRPPEAVSAPFPPRTHSCAELSATDAGKRVVLAGWLYPHRPVSKTLSFFPLRDAHGLTQLVAFRNSNTEQSRDLLADLSHVPVESAVVVQGRVHLRPKNAIRPEPAGDIEVHVHDFMVLNPALRDYMPFLPSDVQNLPHEELRLKHRYLDLRRPALASNLHKRSEVAHVTRNFLHGKGFAEVETPLLLQSSPEGAREFLVPSRISHKGEPQFYALSQSPQQPKQLLICSGGVDKYYQIARCFRDEDGRKDRQPEFTQIDLEMAFVSWTGQPGSDWRIGGGEIRCTAEGLLRTIWRSLEGVELPATFPVMTYADAMAKYGSDKPDTRFDLQIADITEYLPTSERELLRQRDEITECLVVRHNDPHFSATERKCAKDGLAGAVERITDTTAFDQGLKDFLRLQPGDAVWLASRPKATSDGSTSLGRLRTLIAEMAQADAPDPRFLWVTEFPLFTRSDVDKSVLADGRWSSSHHPFTAPMFEDLGLLSSGGIERVRGQHFDLILNGCEIGGGSVRVHDPKMQELIFANILQLREPEMASFRHLLNALRCGAPPHGGMALGFDRLMAILCGAHSIRDVIAFPKTAAGADLLFNSPSHVDEAVLKQYGLRREN